MQSLTINLLIKGKSTFLKQRYIYFGTTQYNTQKISKQQITITNYIGHAIMPTNEDCKEEIERKKIMQERTVMYIQEVSE